MLKEGIKEEPMLDKDGETIGVIFSIENEKHAYAFIVGCRFYEDHEVWWCKRRTPNSSTFIDADATDHIVLTYGLDTRMHEIRNA